MRKGKTTTRLTPKNCALIKRQMLEACRRIITEHGLVIEEVDSWGFEPGFYFEPAFRVSIPAPDGAAYNPDKELFEVIAEEYGLAPDDYGREFSTGRELFRITGIEPRRPKYPISAERIPDRKGFKFTAENVAIFLKA